MENVYYIYDPAYEKLVVTTLHFGTVTDEEQLEHIAKEEGMHWGSCLWGGVRHISIEVVDE